MTDKVSDDDVRQVYGRMAVPVHGDNIEFSRARREARIAASTGRATPEQRMLLEETDRVVREALSGMRRD